MKTAVLISGGVDSSVALRATQDAGEHDLTAFYIKVWLEDEAAFLGNCPWEEDVGYARSVCETAGVEFEIVPLQAEYLESVVTYTVRELRAGRTPSPDVLCNQRIKFGALLDRIGRDFGRVVSGHYARVYAQRGTFFLQKGRDPIKDQTYFLSHLSQSQLSRCSFPIGNLTKAEVRARARDYDLPNRDRPDSQGLCFLGKIRFADFVKFHLGDRAGEIREVQTERVLGEHRGYWFHTIGQRRGLGLSNGPWFVVGKNIERNIVYVSHQRDLAGNERSAFAIEPPHWIVEPGSFEALQVKIRHSERVYDCRLRRAGGGRFNVTLAESDPGIAPGQFAVFYDGETCLGGGVILATDGERGSCP